MNLKSFAEINKIKNPIKINMIISIEIVRKLLNNILKINLDKNVNIIPIIIAKKPVLNMPEIKEKNATIKAIIPIIIPRTGEKNKIQVRLIINITIPKRELTHFISFCLFLLLISDSLESKIISALFILFFFIFLL
jgi:hypothetical protein